MAEGCTSKMPEKSSLLHQEANVTNGIGATAADGSHDADLCDWAPLLFGAA